MNDSLILIGPVGVGKTTVAKLLSEKLNIPRQGLDDNRWSMYENLGYDYKKADQLMKEGGFLKLYQYWKPFEAKSVPIVLEKYKNHIIDFGAGQSVYENPSLFKIVEEALRPYKNIFLLLPSEDTEESLRILEERSDFQYNRMFIESATNIKLAKHIIYTKGFSPEEVCEEICRVYYFNCS